MSALTIPGERRKRLLWSIGIAALAAGMSIAGSANASTLTLSGFAVNGSVSLGIAANTVFLTAPGTVSLPPPNDFGTGTATATVGSIPNISVAIDSRPFGPGATAGGIGQVDLTYHMEYFNPGAGNVSFSPTINTSNVLTQSGGTTVQSLMTIGSYVFYECLTGATGGCGSTAHAGAPFASGPINLFENTDYTILLRVIAQGGVGTGSASIDPWFFAPLSDGGQFIFSPGITAFDGSATPIPAALPLFASGLGLMGFLAKRRKRQGAGIAA